MKFMFWSFIVQAFVTPIWADDLDSDPVAGETSWPEDVSFTSCPLEGLKDGRVILDEIDPDSIGAQGFRICIYDFVKQKQCLKLPGKAFNQAKSSVICGPKSIKISSSMPFSSATSDYALNWKNGQLKMANSVASDSSAETIKKAEKCLAAGDIAGAVENYNQVLYPQHYFQDADIWSQMITKSYALSHTALNKKNYSTVVKTMKPAIDFRATDQIGTLKPAAAETLTAINDYGFCLDKINDWAGAESIFKEVLKLDPERTVAYLNLGDVQFSQKKEATAAYRAYAQRTPLEKWPARIKVRCPSCEPKTK